MKIVIRKRLNEPVSDVWKLYGYKVITKTIFKNSKETIYFFDLKDVLSGYDLVLRKIRVSKKIYDHIDSGKTYPLDA